MGPVLHQVYSFDDAITSFGNETLPDFFCRDNFIVIPKVVFCLITLGDPATDAFLQSPSSLIWKHPDCQTWLPGKVTEVWDRSGPTARKLRDHHLFLRLPDEDVFCYVGAAHLASYGYGGRDYSANFHLEDKLPRDIWLRYGGYSGWLVDVNHREHRVESHDLQTFRHLVAALSGQEFSHLCMTRYEEDSLTLYTNDNRGWLMYLREPADSGLYTHDVNYEGNPKTDELFRCGCGIDLQFPARSTLSRESAIRVAADFFASGELPQNVPWSQEIPGLE